MECRACHNHIDVTPVDRMLSNGLVRPTIVCRYCGTDNTPDTPYADGFTVASVSDPKEMIRRDRLVDKALKREKK